MDFFEKQIDNIKKTQNFRKKAIINKYVFSENLRKIIGMSPDDMKSIYESGDYIKIPYSKGSIKYELYKYYLRPIFETQFVFARVYFKFYDSDYNRLKLTLELAEDIYNICREVAGLKITGNHFVFTDCISTVSE